MAKMTREQAADALQAWLDGDRRTRGMTIVELVEVTRLAIAALRSPAPAASSAATPQGEEG